MQTAGGALTASAESDIRISAPKGDLIIRDVISRTESVAPIASAGSILDANPIEREDLRSQAELIDLWTDELALIEGTDSAAAHVARQLDALQAAEQARYVACWRDRDGLDPTPADAAIAANDAALRASLQANAEGNGAVETFEAQRATLEADWDAQAVFDPDFRAIVPDILRTQVVNDATWTQNQLERFVDAGLVRRSAATQIRDEAPNLRAPGRILLTASRDIGTGLAPLQIFGDEDDALSTADLATLGAAEVGDISFDAGAAFVAQRDDVNVEVTPFDADGAPLAGFAGVASGQNMLIGARTPLRVALAGSRGLTLIKSDGNLTQSAGFFSAPIEGRQIVLESGRDGSIGTVAASLEVKVAEGGSLDARAGRDVFLAGIDSDLPLASLFAGGDVRLTVQGALTDARPIGAARIVGGGTLSLSAQSIGTDTTPLRFELPQDAAPATDAGVFLGTSGEAFVEAAGDLDLVVANIGGGGRIGADGAIRILQDGASTGVIGFGDTAALALDAPDGLTGTRTDGPDIAGGFLTLTTGGDVGGAFGALSTALTGFNYTSTGSSEAPTRLSLSEADDLIIGTLTQTAGEELVTRVTLPGNLAIGRIDSRQPIDIFMPSGAILIGSIRAPDVTLVAPDGIGAFGALQLETDLVTARSFGGADQPVAGRQLRGRYDPAG